MSKLREKIRKNEKRRLRRMKSGRRSTELIKLKATRAEQHSFSDHHPGVLLAVEETLTSVALDASFDDLDVAQAIRGTLGNSEPSSRGARRLVVELNRAREECGCDQETWHNGLRVVYRSLTDQSNCRRDEVSYLISAAKFVAQVRDR